MLYDHGIFVFLKKAMSDFLKMRPIIRILGIDHVSAIFLALALNPK